MKKKVLFLIHDLGQGGAEKVLVNLVNNMDREAFDITVMSLFAGGVNEQFLNKDIRYQTVFPFSFPGNSQIMKAASPALLHKLFIRERYDIEVAYLEGPAARVIYGCNDRETGKVAWIHVEQHSLKKLSHSFRSVREALHCYTSFDRIICVSEYVKKDFLDLVGKNTPCRVIHNTIEADRIRALGTGINPIPFDPRFVNLTAMGSLKPSKGFERLIRIIYRLRQKDYFVRLYILGQGPQYKYLQQMICRLGLQGTVYLTGYHTNPYPVIAGSDLFVCSSFAEGMSTAVTEALILGVPVCTVEVSGMKELLGQQNEYGLITANNIKALYKGIRCLLDDRSKLAFYKEQAKSRGLAFGKEVTVKTAEEMLLSL